MSLLLRKKEDETWREAALRYAKPFGLEEEVEEYFDRFTNEEGLSDERAAWEALYEWDLLDCVNDSEEEPKDGFPD